jgi:hypothetical protein
MTAEFAKFAAKIALSLSIPLQETGIWGKSMSYGWNGI